MAYFDLSLLRFGTHLKNDWPVNIMDWQLKTTRRICKKRKRVNYDNDNIGASNDSPSS